MNETGEIIQELRKRAGFTQKSLAEALHITDKAISKWERGICLPDVTLLPRLSLLLDVDLDVLVSKNIEKEKWIGFIDIKDCDFSQIVYDKPLIYYILSHYLLLGILDIYVLTNEKNKVFLKNEIFKRIGFRFQYKKPSNQNMMIINQPWFVFGSDLTQQFYGAMLSERNTKLIPENQKPVFYFSFGNDYLKDYSSFIKSSSKRTLGRGMVCLDMGNTDKILEVASFIKTYQSNSGLLIGSIEEIAYRHGRITQQDLYEFAKHSSYEKLLRNLKVN